MSKQVCNAADSGAFVLMTIMITYALLTSYLLPPRCCAARWRRSSVAENQHVSSIKPRPPIRTLSGGFVSPPWPVPSSIESSCKLRQAGQRLQTIRCNLVLNVYQILPS